MLGQKIPKAVDREVIAAASAAEDNRDIPEVKVRVDMTTANRAKFDLQRGIVTAYVKMMDGEDAQAVGTLKIPDALNQALRTKDLEMRAEDLTTKYQAKFDAKEIKAMPSSAKIWQAINKKYNPQEATLLPSKISSKIISRAQAEGILDNNSSEKHFLANAQTLTNGLAQALRENISGKINPAQSAQFQEAAKKDQAASKAEKTLLTIRAEAKDDRSFASAIKAPGLNKTQALARILARRAVLAQAKIAQLSQLREKDNSKDADYRFKISRAAEVAKFENTARIVKQAATLQVAA